MKQFPFRLAAALCSAALLCACEKDDVKDKIDDAKDLVGLSDGDERLDTTGIWNGTSGAGQSSTRLSLVDKDGALSGTVRVLDTGDTRSVRGTRSGETVTLSLDGGDVWYLKHKGNKMTGSGDQYGTDVTYALDFAR